MHARGIKQIVLLFVMAFTFGCIKPNPVGPGEDTPVGSISFRIAVSSYPFKSIAFSATLTISGSDMKDIKAPLTITDSSVQGLIKGIPAGKARTFTVLVFDSTKTPIYKGIAIADVKADTTNFINITIYRIIGSVNINGTIVESPLDSLPTDGLVAYYPFNGNANDESGNGNNGIVSGATLTTDRFGVANRAYNFDGSSSIRSTYPGVPDSTPRTLSIWMKTTVPGDFNYNQKFLFSFGTGPSGGMFGGELSTDNTNAHTVEVEGNNTVVPYYVNVTDGQWHCITYVVPNMPGPKFSDVGIYVDTLLLSPQALTVNPNTPVNTILGSYTYIGANEYGTGLYFNGQLDDFRIYNRELTPTEIKKIAKNKP